MVQGRFTSKRNEVVPVRTGDGLCVIKRFARMSDAENEQAVYALLSGSGLRTPELLTANGSELRLSYVPGLTFTELLERQEQSGIAQLEAWDALAAWLARFFGKTGLVIGDCNLRNFILCENGEVCGLDFESCRTGDFLAMAGSVCAFAALYRPEKTRLKTEISEFLQSRLAEYGGLPPSALAQETYRQESLILARRRTRALCAGYSAVILAGGKSTRMGKNKAELELDGMSFAEYQVAKLRDLGFRDVILSGYEKPVCGARAVGDVYPEKGPLGGIYAGLCAAENESCFVISVDAPLCPADTIAALLSAHGASAAPVTVLEHGRQLEPLIGVYSRSISPLAGQLLRSGSSAVMRLLDSVDFSVYDYTGDPAAVGNCNTPEEYRQLMAAFNNIGKK